MGHDSTHNDQKLRFLKRETCRAVSKTLPHPGGDDIEGSREGGKQTAVGGDGRTSPAEGRACMRRHASGETHVRGDLAMFKGLGEQAGPGTKGRTRSPRRSWGQAGQTPPMCGGHEDKCTLCSHGSPAGCSPGASGLPQALMGQQHSPVRPLLPSSTHVADVPTGLPSP